jgi:hypothetical protein
MIAMLPEQHPQLHRKQGERSAKIQFTRGPYFDRCRSGKRADTVVESPLQDPLRAIGFDAETIGRILRQFEVEQIQLWADVTLAAIERKGPSFFRRSHQAFFMDNIQNAARGHRTPPEWFWTLRSEEQQRRADQARRMRGCQAPAASGSTVRKRHTMERAFRLDQSPAEFVANISAHFLAAGQAGADARRNAEQFAKESFRTRQTQGGK